MPSSKPGSRWRLLAHANNGQPVQLQNSGIFDELVVDDWLHIEQMSARCWWMQLGHCHLWIHVQRNGDHIITMTEGTVDTEGVVLPPEGYVRAKAKAKKKEAK